MAKVTVWQPINYLINDSLIELQADELAITIAWDDTAHATMEWPVEGGYAVCEQVEVDAPGVPVMPDDVREAIDDALTCWIIDAVTDVANSIYPSSYEDARQKRIDIVRQWLDTLA